MKVADADSGTLGLVAKASHGDSVPRTTTSRVSHDWPDLVSPKRPVDRRSPKPRTPCAGEADEAGEGTSDPLYVPFSIP
jgi:hypothetical protein